MSYRINLKSSYNPQSQAYIIILNIRIIRDTFARIRLYLINSFGDTQVKSKLDGFPSLYKPYTHLGPTFMTIKGERIHTKKKQFCQNMVVCPL